MARRASAVRELAKRIEALPPNERYKLLRKALTPQMELRMLAEELGRRTRGHDPRAIARAVDRTVREVRRARAAQSRRT